MKKYMLILKIVLPAALFTACSKEKMNSNTNGNNNNPAAVVSRIKTWSNSSSQNTYLYNNDGKLAEVSSNTGSKFTYEYPSGKIIMKQYNNAGINDFTAEYDLNEAGLVITEKRPSQPTFTATLIYNNQKQPVKRIYNYNGTVDTQDFFYSNENCDSIRYSSNGNWQYTRHFTYYTDKFNYLSNEAYGYPFFGKESKNLVKTDLFKYAAGNSTEPFTVTYEFDPAGRPVKETKAQGANSYINFISYY